MALAVSHYTIGSGYEQEAGELAETLAAWGLDHYITAVDDQGSWCRNAQYKSRICRAWCTFGHGDSAVVYLDADARVRAKPILFDELFDQAVDVAVHYRDGWELLSGTIWLRRCDATRRLAERWVELCDEYPDEWDQRLLSQAIVETSPRVRPLPASYCQIFDTMAHHGDPVIEHMQASRRLKHGMGSNPER